MPKFRAAVVLSVTFLVGLLLGAALIHRPIPNAPVELPPARRPWNPRDVLGLVGSLGIRAMAGHLDAIPGVVMETDRTFAIEIPDRWGRIHFVLVPKKDIRDIGQVTPEDQAYLTDAFLMASRLAKKEGLRSYRLYTNDRTLQSVAYLHFHLVGSR